MLDDRHLQADPHDLEDLVAALRRHDHANAVRLLARWSGDGPVPDYENTDSDCWDDDMLVPYADQPLSGWIMREAAVHVDGGRFEHALCLVERYRPPATPPDPERQPRFSF